MKTQDLKNPASTQARCLGPVADLEKHLPPEWWKSLFNSIYLKTDADVVENEQNTKMEVDLLIENTGISTTDHILDLCCGQGRHTIELANRGFQFLTGIDRSRFLIRVARKRAHELKVKIRFSEGDARKIRLLPDSIDCVALMGNSFGYFERQEDDNLVLRAIKQVLRSKGTVFFDVVDGEWIRTHYEPRSWEWIDQRLFVCRERTLGEDGKRIITREVVVDVDKGVLTDQFYAERAYTFEELKSLLEGEGFTHVTRHSNLQAKSTREQDLGMMANRILVTAKAPEKVKAQAQKTAQKMPITVIMGDPRLPDPVKLNGKFNEEDFQTIAKLKEALEMLPRFQFNYMDNHKKLISQLLQYPPEYVLNLCDEGYLNDALKELHVPSLLEMLKIPYTGAGPSCLSICYNKALVRAYAEEMGIPVPEEIWIDPNNQACALPSVFPALVKPSCGDSSIGITKDAVVHNAEELVGYFDKMRDLVPGVPILVQEFLSGNEYGVSIIGNDGSWEILPILQVDFSHLPKGLPRILCYESKWEPESPYWNSIRYIEAKLDEKKARQLIDQSIMLFERLGCRDYARFDFREDANGVIKLLEVNPNPGWCWDGKFNLMARFGGIEYHELLEKVLQAAIERWKK